MKNKLENKIFIIGIVAAIVIYLISKQIEAPLAIFVLSIGVATYQYIYLPKKHKDDENP